MAHRLAYGGLTLPPLEKFRPSKVTRVAKVSRDGLLLPAKVLDEDVGVEKKTLRHDLSMLPATRGIELPAHGLSPRKVGAPFSQSASLPQKMEPVILTMRE